VLVTGGAGMLGSAISKRLAATGLEVVATRRSADDRIEGIEGVGWLTTDLTRRHALEGAGPFDVVVHTAAALPRSHADSTVEAALNRQIDERVLAAARVWAAAVIYMSSTAVYGSVTPPLTGMGEDQPLHPPGAYAAQKVLSEVAGRRQAEMTGRPFTALRISAPYAPGQRSATVLRAFVERAVRGESLLYWGTGARQQSFVHAGDVASACEAALGHRGGTFNITGIRAVTMRELAEIVARAGGLPLSAVQPSGQPDPDEDVRVAYRIERARELLGWKPVISLQQGVDKWIDRARMMPPA
jgi:nucleoside-diphosphate-sugar epimerase